MARQLAPKAHLIHSVVSMHWSLHAALAEFVDNAFAPGKGGANEIWIDFERDRILIWDHGRGVDDINRLFQLGNTSSWEDHSDIGLYGVGATHAAIWLGAALRVTTVHDWVMHRHEADWDRCVRSGRWPKLCSTTGTAARPRNVPKQLLRDGEPTSGTLIEIRRRRSGRKTFKMDPLLERLGFTFSPGIRSGKRIHVRRGERLGWLKAEPFEPPALTERIEFESNVATMRYRCKAGLMLEPATRYNGFFYGFTHRILEKTRDPFRDGDSSMVYADVQLSGDWRQHIADHKSAVVRYRDELAADLFEHCRSLIERGREFEYELHVEELQTRIQQMVDGMMKAGARAAATGERGTDSESTSRPESERDEKPRPAPDPEGDRKVPVSGVVFRFESMSVISLCEERSGRLVVRLNKDDPNVRAAMEAPINSWGLVTHIAAAVTSYLLAKYLREGERALQRYVPGIKLHPAMDANEVTAEIMTILMRAFPASRVEARQRGPH